jgi:DNA-binding NarL/FixJ family response regulator
VNPRAGGAARYGGPVPLRLIEAQPDLELVGTCTHLDELLASVDATAPDVVITDIRMPPTGRDEGIRAAEPSA